ncbi:hypothetical protein [Litorihabitans aurantiacus]|uniref:hypothetical protein n=1 Tax=Litorihabitans aurantiacus TaxID=1930061 RepID=UPI0024E1933E|nr:hypothetical protein [Litorihabitans aurantiacus]
MTRTGSGRGGARRSPVRVLAVAAVSVLGVGVAASGSLLVLGSVRTTSPSALAALAQTDPTSTRTPVGVTGPDASPRAGGGASAVVGGTSSTAHVWPAGWTSPEALPGDGRVVAAHDLEGGGVRVDLVVDGEDVTVVEARGGLRLSDVTVERSRSVGDLDAHLVEGWWAAQVGRDVVVVHAASDAVALEVLEEFDQRGSAGVMASLSRGWQVIAGG